MQVGEDALVPSLLKMPVLEDPHDGLEDDDGANNEDADDHMGMRRVLEVAQIVTDSDPEGHAANHHDEGCRLDRDVHRHDLILKASILQVRNAFDGQMDGDCAKGIKDDENNRHDEGMRVSFPIEGFEGIRTLPLMYVFCIELAMDLLAKDYLRCLIAGQTVAPIFIRSTH